MSPPLQAPACRPHTDKTRRPERARVELAGIALIILLLAGCGGGGGGGGGSASASPATTTASGASPEVVVNWNANHQSAVNTTGGGYLVYFSQSSGFSPGDPGVQSTNVPYTSGPQTPTSATLNLAAGTWYIRVQAYSALTGPTSTGGSYSTPSAQISVTVP